MPRPNRFAAVDTEVLLALEAGDEECQGAVDLLSHAGFYFIVTETPMQELADICLNGESEEIQQHAKKTLVQITNFGFLVSSLGAVQMGVADQVARKLVEKQMPQCDLNDALSVTEAAYNNCRFLITKSETLLNCDRFATLMALQDADLYPVLAASPKEILEHLK